MPKSQSQDDSVVTPILILWDGILSIPVVGIMDSIRSQRIMDDVLMKIQETSAKVAIVDIRGVPAVDTAVASYLIKIAKATKLMGCRCIISGMSPAIAQTIVHLGVDLGDVTTVATKRDALQAAFAHIGLKVVPVTERESLPE